MSDRRGYIGASDVAAILGVSRWKTPVDLYLSKIEPSLENVSAQKQRLFDRGHRWEPIALDMLLDSLEDQYGRRPELIAKNQRYTDAEYDFLACEIDAESLIEGEHVNLELKTVHIFAAKDWGAADDDGTLTDEIPIEYAAQTMFGLGITKRKRCIVGALFGADKMVPYEVMADQETISDMRARCVSFWNDHILARIPPEPVNLDDLARLYTKRAGRPVELNEPIMRALRHLSRLRYEEKRIGEEIDAVKFNIEHYIGKAWDTLPEAASDDAELRWQGMKVGTWKRQRAAHLDQKRLKEDFPQIVADYTIERQQRILRIAKEVT